MYIWFTSYWEEPCLTSDLKQDYFKTNIHELICNPQILKKRATNLAKWTLKPITKRRSICVRTRFGLVFSWDCKLHHTNAQTQWKVIKWKVIIEVYGKKSFTALKSQKHLPEVSRCRIVEKLLSCKISLTSQCHTWISSISTDFHDVKKSLHPPYLLDFFPGYFPFCRQKISTLRVSLIKIHLSSTPIDSWFPYLCWVPRPVEERHSLWFCLCANNEYDNINNLFYVESRKEGK